MQIRRQSSADASVPGVQGPKPRTIWILGPAKDGSPTTLRFPLAKSYCLQKYLPWHFPKQLSSLETSQGTMLSLGGTILATQSLFQNYLNWIEFSHRIGVPKCIGSVLSVLKNKQKKNHWVGQKLHSSFSVPSSGKFKQAFWPTQQNDVHGAAGENSNHVSSLNWTAS